MKMKLVAEFTRPDQARLFADKIREPDWWAISVDHRYNTRNVVWECDPYEQDGGEYAEKHYFDAAVHAVGYYGSTQRDMARLTATIEASEGQIPRVWTRACPAVL